MTDPFEIVQEVEAPKLPGTVVVRPAVEGLLDAVAADVFAQATACVREFGDFHLALSPGRLIGLLCVRLMVDPRLRGLPWSRTHLWLTDEARVDPSDAGSGFAQISQLLVEPSGIPPGQVHAIPGGRAGGDLEYEAQLREHLGWRERGHDRLDCVVLDLLPDATVGGVRPGCGAIEAEDRQVVWTGEGENDRVVMSLKMLNASRLIAVLADGEPVTAAVSAVLEGAPARTHPACGLEPLAGRLRWYLTASCVPSEDEDR